MQHRHLQYTATKTSVALANMQHIQYTQLVSLEDAKLGIKVMIQQLNSEIFMFDNNLI